MSGHSKWSTIKRQKGVADAKKGQTFTKIANAVTIATRLGGGGDPESNPRLRMAIDLARDVNMPKENIQRAIDRGLGRLPDQKLEEAIYEGFGPGRVAYIVEAVTDNKMRTLSEVRNIFERSGGSLAGQGSVSYMFEQMGEIRIAGKGGDSNSEILEIIDQGAEDVEDLAVEDETGKKAQIYLVYTKIGDLSDTGKNLTQAGFKVESSELVMKPKVTQVIENVETAKKVIDFTQKLEDLDDVQKIYPNFDIPENIISTL